MRGKRPFTPRRKGAAQKKQFAMWLTKGLVAFIFVFLVWVGAQVTPVREYLRLVFVGGAASAGPLARWLDWQPQGESVQPVWSRITGRNDGATYDLPVEGTVHTEGSAGVSIETAPGELVHTVLDGRVTELDMSQGRVVVFHGNGMYTSYSGCSDLAVQIGARVSTRDVLGRVGPSGRVFFGVVQGGRNVDPLLRARSEGP